MSLQLQLPRWKIAIEKAISEFPKQTVIQIATIESVGENGFIPRVRCQIFREFLDSPTNPALPLLVSSTDIRTPKVSQLTSEPMSEVVWWIEGTQQQFRIIADVFIVPNPMHPLHSHFKQCLLKARSNTALSLFRDEAWESRRVNVFKSMSPYMKASWCRPIPGSKLEGGQEEAKKWPVHIDEPDANQMPKEKYEEAKRLWDMALSNFALVLIDPVEIDLVDLGCKPDKRLRFTKNADPKGEVWNEEELVP